MKNFASMIAAASLLYCAAAYGWRAPMRDLPKGISLETASAAEQRGDIARARSDYSTAVAYYQRAITAGGPNAALYNKLGIVELKLKQEGAARKSFLAAIKTDPHNATALNNLGALMCLERKYKSALNYEKEALELDEENPAFHVNMAEAWAGMNQIDRAMTEYARALELDPDVFSSSEDGVIAQVKSPEQLARMDYLIAKTFARRGNLEGALDYLRRARDGHYPQLDNVYVDKEFAALWQDPRLQRIIKP